MEDLDFHRPELDGRNQCESQADVVFPNGKRPRCIGEKDHTLDHAGDGFYWTEEEAFKPINFKIDKALKWIDIILWVWVSVMVIYAAYRMIVDADSAVPLWWIIGAYGGAALLVAESMLKKTRKR